MVPRNFIGSGIAFALALVALAGTGCQSRMYDENVQLHQQNRELQAQNSELQARAKQTPDQSQVSAEVAARDARIRELEQSLNDARTPQQASAVTPAGGAASTPPSMGAGIEVRQDTAAGTVTVDLPGDVLFESGKAMLNESSKVTLNKVAAAIKHDYSNKVIRIDGHTDSDPIVHSAWKSNQELSAARAKAVAAYLESQGVPASHLQTHGYGDTRPRGNDKKVNRRVEVVVMTRENVSSAARGSSGAEPMSK